MTELDTKAWVALVKRLKKKHPRKSYKQIITALVKRHPQTGRGIWQNIKAALKGPRQNFPPSVRSWIAKVGGERIVKMEVRRVPIIKVIDRAINLITQGDFDAKKAALGYDNMFHLFAVMWLQNGSVFKIEKNHVVMVTSGEPSGGDAKSVNMSKSVTVQQLMDGAVKYRGKELFVYDAVHANCQDFVSSLLRGSGLMTSELNSFINQDAEAVIDKKWHPVAKAVTDLAGIGDVLMNGEGMRTKLVSGRPSGGIKAMGKIPEINPGREILFF